MFENCNILLIADMANQTLLPQISEFPPVTLTKTEELTTMLTLGVLACIYLLVGVVGTK